MHVNSIPLCYRHCLIYDILPKLHKFACYLFSVVIVTVVWRISNTLIRILRCCFIEIENGKLSYHPGISDTILTDMSKPRYIQKHSRGRGLSLTWFKFDHSGCSVEACKWKSNFILHPTRWSGCNYLFMLRLIGSIYQPSPDGFWCT